MQSLNFKLKNESQSPFHAYLLLSDSSKYVLDQSVQFASTISLSENNDQEHPDIRVIESENINTIGTVSYTHLRAHETKANLVCRLLLEKKK